MVFRHKYKGGIWVDLEQPTQDEIREIASEFGVSERIEQELLFPTPIPLVAVDGDLTLLVLHFPAHGEEDGEDENQEVDVVVGKNAIITVRYEVVAPLYHLKKLFETQDMLGDKEILTTDMLLEILFAHLYASVRNHTNHVAARLERLEHEMFDGRERHTIRAVSNVNREFLHIDAALANQEESLMRFLKLISAGFGAHFEERASRILAERLQIARLIGTYRAVATELRETNLALLESRQNEIMKLLTIITVMVLPLELIAVTLAIRAPGTPAALVDDPNGFWLVLAVMAATALLMAIFFARKKWF